MPRKNCTVCKVEKDYDQFGINKKLKSGINSHCKQCHKEKEALRRKLHHRKTLDQASARYYRFKEKCKDFPLSQKIDFWARQWIYKAKYGRCPPGRSKEYSDRLSSKNSVTLSKLIEEAEKAVNKFPYIQFMMAPNSIIEYRASVDRIDSSKDYSDNNIQVVPLWFNSAKNIMKLEELEDVMRNYIDHIEKTRYLG